MSDIIDINIYPVVETVDLTIEPNLTTININTVNGGGGAVDSVNGKTGVVVLNQDDVLDGTTYKQYSQTEKTKLAGIAAGATNVTKTSDLINDGDDGNPFISLLDLPSNIIFYPTNVASDISGYVKIVTSITDPSYNTTAVDVSTGAITTTNQLISSLATAPNIIVGNPGVFNITTIGNIRRISGSGEASFYFQVYKRTSGGVETLIATSDNTIPVLDSGTYVEFSATAIWDDGIFSATDRVVMKYYANRIAGGSNPTYEFQFGGVTPVRTLVPIPLSVVPILTIDAVPTDGSTNAVSSNGVFDALALKQNVLTNPISGTGANGQVSFWDGTNSQTGDNTFFWDNTNKRLRINQLTDAGFRLDVNGTARVQGNLTLTAGASSSFRFNSSVFVGRIGLQNLINQDTFFDLFTNLGDGTKSAGFAIWAKGTPSGVTNSELLEFRYDGVNTRYSLNVIQSGTGTLRPFHLYIGTNTNQLKLQTNGNVSINSASDNASAQLQVDSTTRGFLPPRMTTTQKNAIATPTAGLVVYDTTLNKLCVYTTIWETITSL